MAAPARQRADRTPLGRRGGCRRQSLRLRYRQQRRAPRRRGRRHHHLRRQRHGRLRRRRRRGHQRAAQRSAGPGRRFRRQPLHRRHARTIACARSPSGTISTVAGSGTAGFGGDGGAATSAQLNAPFGVAVDAAGNVYIADFGNNRVRKVATDGTITTVAGTGVSGLLAAMAAQATSAPAQRSAGGGRRCRRQPLHRRYRQQPRAHGRASGVITHRRRQRPCRASPATAVAATMRAGRQSRPASPSIASATSTSAMAAPASARSSLCGFITTIAGGASRGYSGDGGSATDAQLNGPSALADRRHRQRLRRRYRQQRRPPAAGRRLRGITRQRGDQWRQQPERPRRARRSRRDLRLRPGPVGSRNPTLNADGRVPTSARRHQRLLQRRSGAGPLHLRQPGGGDRSVRHQRDRWRRCSSSIRVSDVGAVQRLRRHRDPGASSP